MSQSFSEDQRRFFEAPDVGHFRWQTTNPYIARSERALLAGLRFDSSTRILEVGCGEGGNLVNVLAFGVSSPESSPSGEIVGVETSAGLLTPSGMLILGLDLFERKLVFANREAIPARFVCGDALRLPLPDQSFDLVLCRDVLHHVDDQARAVSELRRVCRPDGTVWIIEPNGHNPLIRLLALARPHERGLLRNSLSSLRRLVSPQFRNAEFDVRQPMPIYRLLLHYQFGIPGLGRNRVFAAAMDGWEKVARKVIPRSWWAYVVITANP